MAGWWLVCNNSGVAAAFVKCFISSSSCDRISHHIVGNLFMAGVRITIIVACDIILLSVGQVGLTQSVPPPGILFLLGWMQGWDILGHSTGKLLVYRDARCYLVPSKVTRRLTWAKHQLVLIYLVTWGAVDAMVKCKIIV